MHPITTEIHAVVEQAGLVQRAAEQAAHEAQNPANRAVDDALAAAIANACTAELAARHLVQDAVALARAEGLTWSQIADAIHPGGGLTKQAVQQRYGHLIA